MILLGVTVKSLRIACLLGLVAILGACSTHFDTSKQEGVSGRVIYRLEQGQAFALAYNSIVAVLPGRNITEINGAVRGYETYSRFVLDTYTQVVMVVPVKGATSDGELVEGFSFEISGSGSSGSGQAKNYKLRDEVQARLDDLDVAVVVTSIQGRPYKTAVERKTPELQAPPSGKAAEERLKELDRLYGQGLISEEEYNRKRAEIIDSL